jgi:hypothetical protein
MVHFTTAAGRRLACISRSLVMALGASAVIVLALFLASCGLPSPGNSTTGTQESGRYAYLYSGIDYPLQIAVASGDTVTLTLSLNSNLAATAPGQGQGKATEQPIPLPTNLAAYRDIAVAASATTSGPIVWQLTSAPRQSLLSPLAANTPRYYLPSVRFTWHVVATVAGANTAQIDLTLFFVYLNGATRAGDIVLTPTPVPILAVAANPLLDWLAQIKLPFVSLTTLAGVIGLFRFVQGAVQTAHDTVDTVKKTVEVAGKMGERLHPAPRAVAPPDQLLPTLKRPDKS